MNQNIQNYLNSLINKSNIRYLDISTPSSVSKCSHCNKKSWEEPTPQLTGEIEDLKEFKALMSINASNAKLTKIEGLFTLPNKEKLKKINFYGNKIKEVDFATLLTNFPNLQSLSLYNNPVSAVNLQKLSKDQLKKLIENIKTKKFLFCPYKSTVLQDLLHYLQDNGHTSHANEIANLIQTTSVQRPDRNSRQEWLIGGVIGLLGLMGLVGYWIGKRKTTKESDDE